MRSVFAMVSCWICLWVTAAPVADFKLMDVNTASARAGSMVGPRDYRLQVSGYYFGAAH